MAPCPHYQVSEEGLICEGRRVGSNSCSRSLSLPIEKHQQSWIYFLQVYLSLKSRPFVDADVSGTYEGCVTAREHYVRPHNCYYMSLILLNWLKCCKISVRLLDIWQKFGLLRWIQPAQNVTLTAISQTRLPFMKEHDIISKHFARMVIQCSKILFWELGVCAGFHKSTIHHLHFCNNSYV